MNKGYKSMSIIDTRKQFQKTFNSFEEQIEKLEQEIEDLAESNEADKGISIANSKIEVLENKLDDLSYLDMKNESVYSLLAEVKGVDSVYENEDFFIVVPVAKDVGSGLVNTDNFYEYFGDDLKNITSNIQGEVFETANSIGVFAKVNNEDVVITVNPNSQIDKLSIKISGVNEDGVSIKDTLKKSGPKMK